MDTCVRGFSFMPESKVDVIDLQYIEGGELQRTWKTTRRERLKQQEQKIWDEFVKEQDIVESVFKDDPYQFLEQLPESCLKELLEVELQKMQKEGENDEEANEQKQQGDGRNSPPAENENVQNTVTFADESEKECEMFRIFDDEQSELEEANESAGSVCTVREGARAHAAAPDDHSTKSSENVTNMIESSIYCAKVKDLRMKINDELLALISIMERQNVVSVEPEDVPKVRRHSAEWCSRFSRVYLYPLQRQIHDIERNSSTAPPHARRTHLQAQLGRVASLHHHVLQALQVYRKSVEHSACGGDTAQLACCVTEAARRAAAATAAATAPAATTPAAPAHPLHLYDDDMLSTCDKLDNAAREYTTRLTTYLNSIENCGSRSKKSCGKSKGRKRSFATLSKSTSKSVSETEARLSMYSLDTILPTNGKYKGNTNSSRSKGRDRNSQAEINADAPNRNTKKSPGNKCRRPLMRAGAVAGAGAGAGAGAARGARARSRRTLCDADLRTMVEGVDTCTSSHISREPSPKTTPKQSKEATPRGRSKEPTPRSTKSKETTPRKSQPTTPRDLKLHVQTPKSKNRRKSPIKPNNLSVKVALSTIKSDAQDTMEDSQVEIAPVSKIRCAKREGKVKECVNDGERIERVETPRPQPTLSPVKRRSERDKVESDMGPARCEVTRLLRQLCGRDASGSKSERVTGTKNAQLLYVSNVSPRQPSTPQLLRILEETIQKKIPKSSLYQKPSSTTKDIDKFRLTFNIPEKIADNLFQYRTKFVQHMLTSSLYANSSVGKPWEMVGSVSEQIIDQLLTSCVKELELHAVIQELYQSETQ